MYWRREDVSMMCFGALFRCCCDAHLNDLPIAGRTGARHPGYSLLRRHENAGAILEVPSKLGRCELAIDSLRLGTEALSSTECHGGERRVNGGCGVFWSWRRNAEYCSSRSRRSKE
jgi:hypothetical protein